MERQFYINHTQATLKSLRYSQENVYVGVSH